jgi:hypothetical protein
MHSRYILTEIGGIAADPGLDARRYPAGYLQLLEPAQREKLWTHFQRKSLAVDYVTIDKNGVVEAQSSTSEAVR